MMLNWTVKKHTFCGSIGAAWEKNWLEQQQSLIRTIRTDNYISSHGLSEAVDFLVILSQLHTIRERKSQYFLRNCCKFLLHLTVTDTSYNSVTFYSSPIMEHKRKHRYTCTDIPALSPPYMLIRWLRECVNMNANWQFYSDRYGET